MEVTQRACRKLNLVLQLKSFTQKPNLNKNWAHILGAKKVEQQSIKIEAKVDVWL